MKSHLSAGWRSVHNHLYIIIILFLYQLLWGYLLYRLVNHAVLPLLLRYPDPPPNHLSQLLFFIEGQLRLFHSAEVLEVVVWLIVLISVRLLLTPLIQAGLCHGLHQEYQGNIGLYFFQGMRRHGMKMLLLHLLEWTLLALPLLWMLKKLPALLTEGTLQSTSPQLLLMLGIWLGYGFILHQLMVFVQFGMTGGHRLLPSIWLGLRHFVPILLISLSLGLLSLLALCMTTGLSLWSASLLSLILLQAHHFISCALRLWNISSQFHVWHQHSSS